MRLPVCMSMMDQGGGGVVPCASACMSMMDQGGGGVVPCATACLYVHDGSGGGGGGSTMYDCLSVCP